MADNSDPPNSSDPDKTASAKETHGHPTVHGHQTVYPGPARLPTLQVANENSPSSSSGNPTPPVFDSTLSALVDPGDYNAEKAQLDPGTLAESGDGASHLDVALADGTTAYDSDIGSSLDHETGPQLHDPIVGTMEFVVLLPMVSRVRDVYESVIGSYQDNIEAFARNGHRESALKETLSSFFSRLESLCDYEELEMSESSSMTERVIANWAESCSTKCQFLCSLFEAVKDQDKHIAILARPGRMLDVLEALLINHGYKYDRPGNPGRSAKSEVQGGLLVTLLPTGSDGVPREVGHADLVIAYDSSFREMEVYSAIVRSHPQNLDHPSPLINLVVSHSIEHVELCLPITTSEDEREIYLLNCLEQALPDLGKHDQDFLPDHIAEKIAEWLMAGVNDTSTWPIPAAEAPEGIELSASQLENKPFEAGSPDSAPETTTHPKIGLKRPLNSDIHEDETPKKVKISPDPAKEITPYEEIEAPEPLDLSLTSVQDQTADLLPELTTIDPQQLEAFQSNILAAPEMGSTDTESILREQVKELEGRLKQYELSIRRIARKQQESREDINKLAEADEQRKAETASLSRRLNSRTLEADDFKEKCRALEAELEIARTSLRENENPVIASEARLQDEIRELKAENEKLKKQVANTAKDFEFTRVEYQKSSSRAYELASENTRLEAQLSDLSRADGENRLLLAEFNRNSERADDVARIDELLAMLEERNQEIVKLRSKLNGRRETRGPSVPRSPMLGVVGTAGTNSPRTTFMGTGVGRSRGNSPITTDSSTMPFSHSRDGSGRWGHLTE